MLREIVLPEGVETIESEAFSGCTALEKVTLPKSLKTIGSLAFSGCTALKELSIPEGLIAIADDAFQDCGCDDRPADLLQRLNAGCRFSATRGRKTRRSRRENRPSRTGARRKSARKIRMPVGRRNVAKTTSATRIMSRWMSNYADSAYRSEEREAELKALKFRAHLQRKGCRGRSLTSWEKQGNRTRSKTRLRIEHVFGAMVQRAGNVILSTIGIKAAVRRTPGATAEVKLGLRNLAYNMDRYCTLMLQAT